MLRVFLFVVIAGALLLGGVYLNQRFDARKNVDSELVAQYTNPTEDVLVNLARQDIVEGTGAEAIAGDLISVHYKGTFADGKVFDSSYERGEPLKLRLGAGEVIKGWDIGLLGMRVGGTRTLTIPPELAYGTQGFGSVIPPNATLTFEIELLAIE